MRVSAMRHPGENTRGRNVRLAEPRQRIRGDDHVARLHERAAFFFDLLDQRDRAEAERALARRARLHRIDSSEPPDEDAPLGRAS
jgi:hypothetical protein